MRRVNIRQWVEQKGVKEVWIWGYHGGVVGLWESNMAGPFGDISNSNRDPNDLPVLKKTYTVYHYNYQRGASEAIEDHMHQIEAVLNWVDGRDRTPADQWEKLLFWGKYVGSDRTNKIVHPGCGWRTTRRTPCRTTTGATSGTWKQTLRIGNPMALARSSG